VFVVVYFVIDSVRKLLDTPSYMAVKESHNTEHKHENEKFKEYVRKLRLILNTELTAEKIN